MQNSTLPLKRQTKHIADRNLPNCIEISKNNFKETIKYSTRTKKRKQQTRTKYASFSGFFLTSFIALVAVTTTEFQ
jgi:hypothetical protein